jgi:hypothetical protein
MVGLATVVMFGIVGLAVDVGRLYVTRVELGRSLDAAALSGILELNGQTSGLGYAEGKAEDYFMDNEEVSTCDGSQGVTCVAVADSDANQLTMDATKTINMFFLSVLGINTASVSAHAKAGFGTQYVDAVMVLDATPSMAGSPITNAKGAAIAFKNILLGSSPQGNVLIGVTPFRGCFNPPRSQSDCIGTSQIAQLSYNSSALSTTINGITASSGGSTSATNVCTGLAKGWEIISGTGNHNDDTLYPGNRQYMILLSDGDNAYWGSISYQNDGTSDIGAVSPFSPTGVAIDGTDYPCMPIDATSGSDGTACPSPWNSLSINSTYPCWKGVYTPTSITDNFNSYSTGSGWTGNGGSGWAGNWIKVNSPTIVSSPAQGGSRALELNSSDSAARDFDLTGIGNAVITYYARHSSMESGDHVYVEISTNGGGSWTELVDHVAGGGDLTTSFKQFTIDLNDYAGMTGVRLRWRASVGSSDYFYLDTIAIGGSANGFLNGNDGSHPNTCNEYPTPRERQVDVRSLELAREIKAQGVEIFVVAFSGGVSGCNLNNTTIYDDEDPADCNTVRDTTPGPIGDDTHDGTGNHRLLKCISSSSQGSNDHYYYASDDDELTGIFTQIANQIAHRLLE